MESKHLNKLGIQGYSSLCSSQHTPASFPTFPTVLVPKGRKFESWLKKLKKTFGKIADNKFVFESSNFQGRGTEWKRTGIGK